MKNARPKTTGTSAGTAQFYTDNPRHLRALHALLKRPQRREHLDAVAGCSNSPELVAELRRRGLDVPCTRVQDIDRDGREIRRGVYGFTSKDRKAVHRFFFRMAKGRGQ